MSKRIIKLTETQLKDIVAKVIKEQKLNEDSYGSLEQKDTQAMDNKTFNATDPTQLRIANIAKTLTANKGVLPIEYVTKYQIKPKEQTAAQELIKQQQSTQNTQNQRYVNIANTMGQVDPTTLKIKSTNPKLNGMSWVDYMTNFKVTQDDITKAQAYVATLSKTNPAAATKVAAGVAAASKASKPNPKVIELQKQLKAAGYDIGTTGPNKDGVDGFMGPKTKAAQQQLIQKGQEGVQKMAQAGQDLQNKWKQSAQLTPQQQSDIEKMKIGQPIK